MKSREFFITNSLILPTCYIFRKNLDAQHSYKSPFPLLTDSFTYVVHWIWILWCTTDLGTPLGVLYSVGLYHRFQQFNFFNFQTRFDLVLQHSRGRQLQELIIHTVLGFGGKKLSIECFMMIARIYTSQRIKKNTRNKKNKLETKKNMFLRKYTFFMRFTSKTSLTYICH